MRQVPRADQFVKGAARDVKELRGFLGVEQRFVKRGRKLSFVSFCLP